MEVQLSTLCYLERDGKYLMLHRVVKKNDINKDKWIGVGGHFEKDESPEECLMREVREETGYTLTSYRFRGIVTFVSGDGVTEYMHLFTADGFEGEPIECDEGVLEWVPKEDISGLNIWEGDKIFFRLLTEEAPFFSLKLVYDGSGGLVSAALNGSPMPLDQPAAAVGAAGGAGESAGASGAGTGAESAGEPAAADPAGTEQPKKTGALLKAAAFVAVAAIAAAAVLFWQGIVPGVAERGDGNTGYKGFFNEVPIPLARARKDARAAVEVIRSIDTEYRSGISFWHVLF